MIEKLLIANRGEIAVRIMRTCREMNIRTVAVHSDVDGGAMHTRIADESIAIGGRTAAESYLNNSAILNALDRCGADALHPGYGFLSEDAEFAHQVGEKDVTFVGPSAQSMEKVGDKISARILAESVGVLGVPGRSEVITDASQIVDFGQEFGWPVAIKAAYGGGGRGMRVVKDASTATSAMESAQHESMLYFGRPELYLERYLTWPRHVEVQVFADAHGDTVSLGDRDCSSQRRHQKLIEETPAPGLSPDIRASMAASAIRIAKACRYVNAGTVEFLYDGLSYYFLEMNTRLQVEHAITEMVLDQDLVEWQIRVAGGENLLLDQSEVVPAGHAIECRINAENPKNKRFLPSPGVIERFRPPEGHKVRTDGGYEAGDEVSKYFDSLIAKVIVWGSDREEARLRMLEALGETVIEGVATTIPAHIAILQSAAFINNEHSTRWVEDELELTTG